MTVSILLILHRVIEIIPIGVAELLGQVLSGTAVALVDGHETVETVKSLLRNMVMLIILILKHH